MSRVFVTLAVLLLASPLASAQRLTVYSAEHAEAEGLTPEHRTDPPEVTTAQGGPDVCVDAVLLAPDSGADNLVILDPVTGDVVNGAFLVDSEDLLATPKIAIPNFDGTGIFISDQLEDAVFEFDCNGAYVGIFAPAGGVNNDILDNIRGIAYNPDRSELWVTVASGVNADAIARFDTDGNYLGNFTNATGSPFDIYPRDADVLISDIDNEDIARVDYTGALLPPFVDGDGINSLDFPQQISTANAGGILVAGFSLPSGIYEYDDTGAQIGLYAEGSGPRGVYQLASGNILYTSGGGISEMTSTGTPVRDDYGTATQYIELFDPADIGGGGGVDVSIEADVEIGVVSPGDQLNFIVFGANNGDEEVTVDLYIEVTGPAALRKRLRTYTIPAGASATRTVPFDVPTLSPAGMYTVDVVLGDFDADDDLDSETVMVTVEEDDLVGLVMGTGAVSYLTTEAEPIRVGPNPTDGRTTFTFSLNGEADVLLAVYDVLGREVAVLASGRLSAGSHTATLDAGPLPGGLYTFRYVVDGRVETGRVTVVR